MDTGFWPSSQVRTQWPRTPPKEWPTWAGWPGTADASPVPPSPALFSPMPLSPARPELFTTDLIKGGKSQSLFYLFSKRKHNHSLAHYFGWIHRKKILYQKGKEEEKGEGERKQIACLGRPSVTCLWNLVPSATVGKTIATRDLQSEGDRWRDVQPLP